ncbi:hypothetical protein [Aeoliella sp.]|uniref:hypothetical protein n=1 Tax=Aeoliella sp. TaxID=2795800 RepID=UPI003CCBA06A
MPTRQFTLRWLLIGVTLFCIVMGTAAMFPFTALLVGIGLLWCAPAVVIVVWTLVESNNRRRTLLILAPSLFISVLLVIPRLQYFGGILFDCTLPTTALVGISAAVDSAIRYPNRWPPG